MGLCLPLVLAAATVLVCLTPGLLAASIMNDITAGPGSLQPRILVLGDSLAEEGAGRDGWVSQLHSEYEGSVGMFNLGTSLPNAQVADTALSKLLNSPRAKDALASVALVVLAFGSSEIQASHAGSKEPWATPEAFEKHLASMVQQLLEDGKENIVLVQPPPVASFTKALPYARAVADVARQFQIPYADTLTTITAIPGWNTLALKDNKQLKQEGHNVLFKKVAAEIRQKLAAVGPEAMVQIAQKAAAASSAAAHAASVNAVQHKAAAAPAQLDPSRAPGASAAATAAAAGAGAAQHRGGRGTPAIAEMAATRRQPQQTAASNNVNVAAEPEELPAALMALQAPARQIAAQQRLQAMAASAAAQALDAKQLSAAAAFMDPKPATHAAAAPAPEQLKAPTAAALKAPATVVASKEDKQVPADKQIPAAHAKAPAATPAHTDVKHAAAATKEPAAAVAPEGKPAPAAAVQTDAAAPHAASANQPAGAANKVVAGLDTSKPAGPAKSAVPAVSAAPAKPAVPAVSAAPAKPAVPAVSAAPAKPAVPAVSAAPAKRAVPAVSAAPAKPAVPAVSATPAKPAVPAVSATPAKPAVPAVSAAPAKPAVPAVSATPAKPAAPAVSAAPAKPVAPVPAAPKPAAPKPRRVSKRPVVAAPAPGASRPVLVFQKLPMVSKPAAADKPAAATDKPAVAPEKPAAATDKPAAAAPEKPAAATDKPAAAAPEKPAAATDKPVAAAPQKPAAATDKPAAAAPEKPAAATDKPAAAAPQKPAAATDKPAAAAPQKPAAATDKPVATAPEKPAAATDKPAAAAPQKPAAPVGSTPSPAGAKQPAAPAVSKPKPHRRPKPVIVQSPVSAVLIFQKNPMINKPAPVTAPTTVTPPAAAAAPAPQPAADTKQALPSTPAAGTTPDHNKAAVSAPQGFPFDDFLRGVLVDVLDDAAAAKPAQPRDSSGSSKPPSAAGDRPAAEKQPSAGAPGTSRDARKSAAAEEEEEFRKRVESQLPGPLSTWKPTEPNTNPQPANKDVKQGIPVARPSRPSAGQKKKGDTAPQKQQSGLQKLLSKLSPSWWLSDEVFDTKMSDSSALSSLQPVKANQANNRGILPLLGRPSTPFVGTFAPTLNPNPNLGIDSHKVEDVAAVAPNGGGSSGPALGGTFNKVPAEQQPGGTFARSQEPPPRMAPDHHHTQHSKAAVDDARPSIQVDPYAGLREHMVDIPPTAAEQQHHHTFGAGPDHNTAAKQPLPGASAAGPHAEPHSSRQDASAAGPDSEPHSSRQDASGHAHSVPPRDSHISIPRADPQDAPRRQHPGAPADDDHHDHHHQPEPTREHPANSHPSGPSHTPVADAPHHHPREDTTKPEELRERPVPTFEGPHDDHSKPSDRPTSAAEPHGPPMRTPEDDHHHQQHHNGSPDHREQVQFRGTFSSGEGPTEPHRPEPHRPEPHRPEPHRPEPHHDSHADRQTEHPAERPPQSTQSHQDEPKGPSSDNEHPPRGTFIPKDLEEMRALHMPQANGHKAAPGELDQHDAEQMAPGQVKPAHDALGDKEEYEDKEPSEGGKPEDDEEEEYEEYDPNAHKHKHREHKRRHNRKHGHDGEDDSKYLHNGHAVKGGHRHNGRKHDKDGSKDHHEENIGYAGHDDSKEHYKEEENEEYPVVSAHSEGENEHIPLGDSLGPVEDSKEEVVQDQAAAGHKQDIDSALSGAEEDASKPLIVTLGDYVMRQGSFGTGIVASAENAPGWISRLAAAYGDKAQVVNKGQATATSQQGLAMVEELLKEYPNAGKRVKLVVLSFGGNDAITRAGEDSPKVPIAAYKTNLQTMTSKLREAGITNILLVTPPPAARRADRKFRTIKDYAKAATDTAHSMKVPTVDLFAAVASLTNWQAAAMKEDGLRLSDRGQQLLFKRVMKALSTKLQSVSPTKLVSS